MTTRRGKVKVIMRWDDEMRIDEGYMYEGWKYSHCTEMSELRVAMSMPYVDTVHSRAMD